jgi:hypothetical protein
LPLCFCPYAPTQRPPPFANGAAWVRWQRADHLEPQSADRYFWKAPPAKLDDSLHGDSSRQKRGIPQTAIPIVATYQPNASSDGLAATLGFTGKAADHKPTLTELSSRRIGHRARLIAH